MRTRLRVDVASALALTAFLSGAAATGFSSGPVADAAMRGDLDAVRELIQQGADVNAAQGDGMSALHWAAERGDGEMAEVLLFAGASVHAGTRIGRYTPLHVASRAGSVAVVEALLRAGAAVDAVTTNTGVHPIHLAAQSGSAQVIRLLAARGAEIDVREREWGHTPLIFAAAANRPDAIRALLELGADPALTARVIDVSAQQTADQAARRAREQALAQFRGDQDPSQWQPTPGQLQAAIQAGREVQRRGAGNAGDGAQSDEPVNEEAGPVNATGGWGGLTALLHTARAGNTQAALALLDGGADVNQVSPADRTSALLIAAINGHFDLMTTLLERGGDPTLAADDGGTPLYAVINLQWAPQSRTPQPRAHEFQQTTYLEAMEALLRAGADPDVRLEQSLWYNMSGRNARGATPFWRAAYGTDVEALRLLVAWGADPHIPTRAQAGRARYDSDGNEVMDASGLPAVPPNGPAIWPIHAASGVGYGENYSEASVHRHAPDGWVPTVRYLVDELGADVNARDNNGYNALHHAAARGDVELIRFLVERGADVTALSRRGQTTADMANSPGQRLLPFPEAIALLESLGSKNNNRCTVC